MNALNPFIGAAALIGSALIGGAFFAFSSFVMKALARLPFTEGIATMQSINIVVINPLFLGTFLVTILRNVPHNNELAALSVSDPDSGHCWVSGA